MLRAALPSPVRTDWRSPSRRKMPNRSFSRLAGGCGRVYAGDCGHLLCAGHDGLRSRRRGLEGAGGQDATALARGQTDIQNLAHSLAEHASHTIQSADIAMTGMVDLLKYRGPSPGRFNKYLAETVATLPQIARDRRARCRRRMAVFVAAGNAAPQQFRPEILHLSS